MGQLHKLPVWIAFKIGFEFDAAATVLRRFPESQLDGQNVFFRRRGALEGELTFGDFSIRCS